MYVINHVFKITFLLWGLSNCSRWSTHWWVEGGLGPKIWDLNRPSSNRSNCGLTRRFVWDGQQTVRFQPRQFLDYDKTETDRSWDTHISRLARRVDRIFGVIFTPMYQCSWQDLIRLAGSDLEPERNLVGHGMPDVHRSLAMWTTGWFLVVDVVPSLGLQGVRVCWVDEAELEGSESWNLWGTIKKGGVNHFKI